MTGSLKWFMIIYPYLNGEYVIPYKQQSPPRSSDREIILNMAIAQVIWLTSTCTSDVAGILQLFWTPPISAGNRRKNHLPSTCTFLRSMFEYFTKVYKVLKNLRTTVKCHVKSWFTYTDIIHAVWKTIFHIETVPFQLTFGHSRGSIQSQMHHLWNFWTYVQLVFIVTFGQLTQLAGVSPSSIGNTGSKGSVFHLANVSLQECKSNYWFQRI